MEPRGAQESQGGSAQDHLRCQMCRFVELSLIPGPQLGESRYVRKLPPRVQPNGLRFRVLFFLRLDSLELRHCPQRASFSVVL